MESIRTVLMSMNERCYMTKIDLWDAYPYQDTIPKVLKIYNSRQSLPIPSATLRTMHSAQGIHQNSWPAHCKSQAQRNNSNALPRLFADPIHIIQAKPERYTDMCQHTKPTWVDHKLQKELPTSHSTDSVSSDVV